MTGDEALNVLENYAPRLADGEIPADVAQALAHVRHLVQYGRGLEALTMDSGAKPDQRRSAARRFRAMDEGRVG